MPLSDRDKQRISYSVTDYISKIKVTKIEDFQLMIDGLLFITQPNQGHNISESQRDDFQDLMDYMDPSFMIVAPENQAEFTQFANGLINNRIDYFKKLSNQEKLKYIQDQDKHNEDVKKSHEEKTQETKQRQNHSIGQLNNLDSTYQAIPDQNVVSLSHSNLLYEEIDRFIGVPRPRNLFMQVLLKLTPNRLSVEVIMGTGIFVSCLRFAVLAIIKGKEFDNASGYLSNFITGANNITLSEFISPPSNYYYPAFGVLIAILSVVNIGIFILARKNSLMRRQIQVPEFRPNFFPTPRYSNRTENRDYLFAGIQDSLYLPLSNINDNFI